MKASARISDLKLQVRALQSIGFTGKESIRMIARSESHRIRKAMPEIDRPLPTPPDRKKEKWVEKTDRINEQQKNRPATKETRPEQKPVQKRPTGKHGKPLSFTRFNIKHKDGSVWSYEVKPSGQLVVRPPSQFDTPTYTTEQWQAMHGGINSHIEERSKDNAEKGENKQPAKADTEKESTKMEKAQTQSEKFVSRFGRSRGFQDIATDVQNVQLSETPMQKSEIPFGKTALEHAMSQQDYSKLSGHAQAALRAGLPVDFPGIESMDFNQMKRAAEQLKLDVANGERSKLGLPPLELPPESTGLNASWSQM